MEAHDHIPVGTTRKRNWSLLLLLLPFVFLLYARHDPRLWGIPFFVWYQVAWVLIGSACTYAVCAAVALVPLGARR